MQIVRLTDAVLWAVIILAVLLAASSAEAQSLRTARAVFIGAAAADHAMTYHLLTQQPRAMDEANPWLHPLQERPAALVAASSVADVASMYAWDRWVGRKHPRLAAVGYFASAAWRGYLVYKGSRLLAQHTER